jgi:hypothetical protein
MTGIFGYRQVLNGLDINVKTSIVSRVLRVAIDLLLNPKNSVLVV